MNVPAAPQINNRSVSTGTINLVLLAVFFLFLLAVVLTKTTEWLDRAKIVLSVLMLTGTALSLWIFIHRRQCLDNLYRQEIAADQARDDVLFELSAVRAKLGSLEKRLTTTRRPNASRFNKLLVEHASSALMLFLQKERGLWQWGFWAAKAAKGAFEYLRGTANN